MKNLKMALGMADEPLTTVLHKIMKRSKNIYHFLIRKCKRMVDTLKRVKLMDACINGQGNLFGEIKKLRKSSPTVANAIHGISDEKSKHFADIYGILYNSVDDQVSLHRILRRVNCNISSISNVEVTKVTPAIVYEAINHLKGNRNDPAFQFTSDWLLNAPAILYDHIACVFRSYLGHGHISNILMLPTLIPLAKDNFGDICASNNYRPIAMSSLVLKILNWVIILLYGSKLELDELQFAYQPKCPTNLCTWMVVESFECLHMRHGYDKTLSDHFLLCTISNMPMSNGMELCQSDLLSEMVLSRERYYLLSFSVYISSKD